MQFKKKWLTRKRKREKQNITRIIERAKELEEKINGMDTKNLELETQYAKLKEQSEKLKELDRMKSRFFADIANDFLTPLTLIINPLEEMLGRSLTNKQKKELNVILQNARQLLTLITRLLELSQLDSVKMKLRAAPQNIVPFLDGILASFHLLANQNELELAFQTDEDEISLYFDTQKMEEVMYSLLIHAVKFTPAGGKITVSVSPKGAPSPGFVEISVSGTGIGIHEDQFRHIFDRFYQAAGSGIGLALTKEIVLLHHGKIDIRGREGKGSEFIIQLPMGKAHLGPGEIAPSSEIPHRLKSPGEIPGPLIDKKESEARQNVDTGKSAEPIILIVEDNPIFRKFLRGRLESMYTVVEAADGREGIDKAEELIPDLIISDIVMPEVSGYQLCRELKNRIKTSHIPIILLTGKTGEESIIHGLETGADDYVTKPPNTKILIARVRNLIEQRRQIQLKLQKQKTVLLAEIPVSSMDEVFLNEFKSIIERNLSDTGFSVDHLCREFHMGRAALSRKIQGLTGETPAQYIRSYRLERAVQLLKINNGNVVETALDVGFPNTAEFARCFKEKFNRLPTSFRTSFEVSG